MAKIPSQETLLVREALREVLSAATEPMTSRDVVATAVWQGLSLDPRLAAIHLATLYALDSKPFPLCRIHGASGFEYFNPDVVKLEYREPPVPPPQRRASDPQPTPPEFEFNPVEFQPDPQPTAEPAQVNVPANVKMITLNVGAVTIKIEIA